MEEKRHHQHALRPSFHRAAGGAAPLLSTLTTPTYNIIYKRARVCVYTLSQFYALRQRNVRGARGERTCLIS